MPTLSIHFDPAVLAHLMKAAGDDTVHVTLSLGGADRDGAAAAPVIPHGPLADLMKAGLLKEGTVLAFRQRRAGREGRAVVTRDGQLIVDGQATPFPSPSKAAEAVTGNVVNGWTLWQLPDGRTLDDLRRDRAHGRNVD
ncbi:DUF4357 domain-containing protein [Streptomyces sp. NPDC020719]|uniref:DUF4357 domain-containing protein n=1 Tax=Streptomyces sp. NPDC020719 TaxID=3154896 RepID=UPI0033EF1F23